MFGGAEAESCDCSAHWTSEVRGIQPREEMVQNAQLQAGKEINSVNISLKKLSLYPAYTPAFISFGQCSQASLYFWSYSKRQKKTEE